MRGKQGVRALVALVLAVLTAGILVIPVAASGAAVRTQQQGVTAKEIEMVAIVPDLDTLREKGLYRSTMTNAKFTQRYQMYADEFGPINGRSNWESIAYCVCP